MRILNRPMFRYGGPIKEGVMHGMRNGGRAALVGNPVYPQTGGREHHNIIKNIKDVPKYIKPGYWSSLGKPGTLGGKVKNWWLRNKPSWKTKPGVVTGGTSSARDKYISQTMAPTSTLSKAKSWVKENPWWTAGGALHGSKPAYDIASSVPYKKIALQAADLAVPDWIFDQDKFLAEKKIKTPPPKKVTTSRWDATAPELTASQRTKLAKDQQNARLKNYLDMMGYDSAKKTAMSDALIDASALVQDATTEAGSLKHADWGNLINKAIQTTSRRLDKPAQIREAVGLMATKAEIEKDMLKDKGGALKQNARDLVSAGVYKTEKEALEHLSKKADFEEVVGALAAKKKVDGSVLSEAWRISGQGIPKAHVKGADDLYKNFKDKVEDAGGIADIELEFVKKEIPDRQPGEVYVIDDRLIIIQKDGTPKYRW